MTSLDEETLNRAVASPDVLSRKQREQILEACESSATLQELRALTAVAIADETFRESVVDQMHRQLSSSDVATREDASMVLADLAEEDPRTVSHVSDTLFAGLEAGSWTFQAHAARALTAIAAVDPDAIATAVPKLEPCLYSEMIVVRRNALSVLRELATSTPEAIKPLIPSLVDVLDRQNDVQEDDPNSKSRIDEFVPNPRQQQRLHQAEGKAEIEHDIVRFRAAEVLGMTAQVVPVPVAEETERLVTILDREVDTDIIDVLLDVLAPIAQHFPERMGFAVATIRELLEDDTPDSVKAKTARVLALVADSEAQRRDVANAVEPVMPTLLALLESEDPQVSGGALSLLLYVAETFPAEVATRSETLLELLESDRAFQRATAAAVLGDVGTRESRSRLDRIAADDPAPEVRQTARAASERIHNRTETDGNGGNDGDDGNES